MDTGEWYIEVNGKKVGPFNLDHIQGLLEDGEIRPYHQVTSVMTGGQWISVQEALNGVRNAPQAPPAEIPTVVGVAAQPVSVVTGQAVAEFNPPPRPELAPTEHPPLAEENDAATILFDALQNEKERRTTTIGPYRAKSSGKTLSQMRKVAAKIASVKEVKIPVPLTPRMFWTAVLAGLVLGSLTYGVMRAFKHQAPPPSGSLTPMSATAPVTAGTPAAAAPPSAVTPMHREAIAKPFGQPQRRLAPPAPPPAHIPVPPRYNNTQPNYRDGYRDRDDNSQQRYENYPPRDTNDNDNGYNDNGYPPTDTDNGNSNPNNRMRRQGYPNQNRQYPQQQPYQDNSGDQQPSDVNGGQPDDSGQQGYGNQQQQQQPSQPGQPGQYDQNSQDGYQGQGNQGQQNPNQGNAQGQDQDSNYNQNYTQ